MTLRIAVTCTIHKILYDSDFGDSKYSFDEMAITVLSPKNL